MAENKKEGMVKANHYTTDVVTYKNYLRCTNDNIFIESFYWSILILCIHMFILNSSMKVQKRFTQKQDNVFVNRDMSILVSWRCKDPINRVGLVQSGYYHHHFIKLNLLSPWYS
jgi:hypothetical protein